MTSNLLVKSNLMLDDNEHRPQYRFIPGDYVRKIYPELADNQVSETELSKQQRIEWDQYLDCARCRRRCAGTCGRWK